SRDHAIADNNPTVFDDGEFAQFGTDPGPPGTRQSHQLSGVQDGDRFHALNLPSSRAESRDPVELGNIVPQNGLAPIRMTTISSPPALGHSGSALPILPLISPISPAESLWFLHPL